MKVTTSLDDNEVKSYVEQLEKIVLTGKPFFTYSMKVKKFIFDLIKNYLEERTTKPEADKITCSFEAPLSNEEGKINEFLKEHYPDWKFVERSSLTEGDDTK